MVAIVSQFDGNHQTFDPSIARQLAHLLQQAYGKQFPAWTTSPDSPDWTLEPPFQLTELVTQKVPFGFVVADVENQTIYVVFRGTLRLIEWFKNTKIELVSYQNGSESVGTHLKMDEDIAEGIKFTGQAHDIGSQDFGRVTAGFREIYVGLRKQMIDTLNALNFPTDFRIYVTGHSLGGALATLAIPDILQHTSFQDPRNIILYTFASPRCGDRAFAEKFTETGVRHWRIANTEDFVTMIPFPTGNVFKPGDPTTEEAELGTGGVTGVDANPNPIFGFFKTIYNRTKSRMPDYVHTGTPIYFTIHEASLERHHNLNEVYMLGIQQDPLPET
jgi:triacylglycerol lipase